MLPVAPLFAMHHVAEAVAMLALTGPFWLTAITIPTTAIVLYHRRRSRERELGAEMIRDMLGRKMSADEIERVIFAWTGRRDQLKTVVQAQDRQFSSKHSNPDRGALPCAAPASM